MRRFLIAVLILTALAAGGCASTSANELVLTGRVVDDTAMIAVPFLPGSTPDLEVGFETTGSAGVASGSMGAAAAGGITATGRATSWARVDSVSVGVGDKLNAGDTIATIDDAALRHAYASAQADAKRARANLSVVDDLIGAVTEGRSELTSKTVEIQTTIADLTVQRADIAAKLDAAKQAASAPTTGTVPPSATSPAALVVQLEVALLQIDAGIEQANKALEALAETQVDLDTTKTALQYARDASRAVVDALDIAVRIAETYLGRTKIVASGPCTVLEIAGAGEVLAQGAPLATVRMSSEILLETYVTADQRAGLAPGVQAHVFADSKPGMAYAAHVAGVENEYEFVPTVFATKIIHLTRGFRVTVELDDEVTLPHGTPVDVTIRKGL
ncbi:MAG: HlyD family efflux transporter periplasmic adaptor subunit [Actinomycetota bacterium]|nr:HlyD family efflux transporter periplasmic adaptor subunit [Actinomycetota bacterium]